MKQNKTIKYEFPWLEETMKDFNHLIELGNKVIKNRKNKYDNSKPNNERG